MGRPTRTARAKASPEIGIQDQAQEGLGQRGGVARWDQAPAIVLDDLQRTAGCGGDDGQAGVQGFDEHDTEGFRAKVGLAVKVGGRHELGDVAAFTEERHAPGEPELGGALLEGCEEGVLFRGLRSAGDPAGPGGGRRKGRERAEEGFVSFPGFEASGHEEDRLIRCNAKGGAEALAGSGRDGWWGWNGAVEDGARGPWEQGVGEVAGVAAVDDDQIGARLLAPAIKARKRNSGAVNPRDGGHSGVQERPAEDEPGPGGMRDHDRRF